MSSRRAVVAEILALWLVTLLVIRGLKSLVDHAGAPELILAGVPLLFMYAPVWVCRLRGVDSWSYPLALPAFRDRAAWLGALRLTGTVILVIWLPWLVAYHVYQTTLFPAVLERLGFLSLPLEPKWRWPSDLLMLIGYHLFFAAIPEELFYRGYLQTRLDEVFPLRWRVLGADLGWGWILTCALFAFGHSVVVLQWWHFAIFFPSLVFGWMRARTGGIVAGALFHAWANVQVAVLDTVYGLRPP